MDADSLYLVCFTPENWDQRLSTVTRPGGQRLAVNDALGRLRAACGNLWRLISRS